MKVVILAGGMGTRVKEETEIKPKPMIKIGNKPILWHIMKTYSYYGFKDFIISLGYKGEVIKEYFYNYYILNKNYTLHFKKSINENMEIFDDNQSDDIDWNVTLVDTGENVLKGARIKKIEKYIDGDTFMLTYGDGVANIDLKELLAFHKKHGRIGTVTGVRPPSRFGELIVKGNEVIKFTEKPQSSLGWINGGFCVFNKKIFDYLTADDNCDFEKGPLEALAKDKGLMVFQHSRDWECMDNIRDVEYLNKLWSSGKAFWKVWK